MEINYVAGHQSLSWKIQELLRCDETALEFFGKVRAKKICTGIDFLDSLESHDNSGLNVYGADKTGNKGIFSGKVISISGDHGSGKSELFIQAAVKSALSDEFGGQRQAVVYFSIDSKFDIDRIADVAKFHIIKSKSLLARENHF